MAPSYAQFSLVGAIHELPLQKLPSQLSSIKIPPALGEIQDFYQGPGKQTVVLIQDAHAIPSAQQSIHKLIEYFQQKFGLNHVALEGAVSSLDPQMFKSFPDKDLLKKVFQEYQERGELTGGTAAALFSPSKSDYSGIEDWPLYEEGLGRYQQAVQNEPALLEKITDSKKKIQDQKIKVYSKELLSLDQSLENFYQNKNSLPEVLQKLASFKNPPDRSELALLLQEIRSQNSQDVELEVKRIAEQLQSSLRAASIYSSSDGPPSNRRRVRQRISGGESRRKPLFSTSPSTPLGILSLSKDSNHKKILQEFNQKFQDFQTSRMTAKQFAVFMRDFIRANRIPLHLRISKSLQIMMRHQKRMQDIKGTKLFADFEHYAQSVKDSLFENEAQRELDRRSRELRLLERFAKLELSREDWEEIKAKDHRLQTADNRKQAGTKSLQSVVSSLFSNHFAFYQNAEKRDNALFKNLIRLAPRNTILVAGGFHTGGLTKKLKERGISYLLLMPRIDSVPEQTNYRAHMRGDVSWKKYFEVENGRVSLYKAFVRGTRDRLLNVGAQFIAPSEGVMNHAPTDGSDPHLLKSWRDQIILDLADKNQIEKAHDYTQFLDEVTQNNANKKPGAKFTQKDWTVKVQRFINGLRGLEARHQLTQKNVLTLLNSTTVAIPAANLNPFASLSARSPIFRSEVRFDQNQAVRENPVLEKFAQRLKGYADDFEKEYYGILLKHHRGRERGIKDLKESNLSTLDFAARLVNDRYLSQAIQALEELISAIHQISPNKKTGKPGITGKQEKLLEKISKIKNQLNVFSLTGTIPEFEPEINGPAIEVSKPIFESRVENPSQRTNAVIRETVWLPVPLEFEENINPWYINLNKLSDRVYHLNELPLRKSLKDSLAALQKTLDEAEQKLREPRNRNKINARQALDLLDQAHQQASRIVKNYKSEPAVNFIPGKIDELRKKMTSMLGSSARSEVRTGKSIFNFGLKAAELMGKLFYLDPKLKRDVKKTAFFVLAFAAIAALANHLYVESLLKDDHFIVSVDHPDTMPAAQQYYEAFKTRFPGKVHIFLSEGIEILDSFKGVLFHYVDSLKLMLWDYLAGISTMIFSAFLFAKLNNISGKISSWLSACIGFHESQKVKPIIAPLQGSLEVIRRVVFVAAGLIFIGSVLNVSDVLKYHAVGDYIRSGPNSRIYQSSLASPGDYFQRIGFLLELFAVGIGIFMYSVSIYLAPLRAETNHPVAPHKLDKGKGIPNAKLGRSEVRSDQILITQRLIDTLLIRKASGNLVPEKQWSNFFQKFSEETRALEPDSKGILLTQAQGLIRKVMKKIPRGLREMLAEWEKGDRTVKGLSDKNYFLQKIGDLSEETEAHQNFVFEFAKLFYKEVKTVEESKTRKAILAAAFFLLFLSASFFVAKHIVVEKLLLTGVEIIDRAIQNSKMESILQDLNSDDYIIGERGIKEFRNNLSKLRKSNIEQIEEVLLSRFLRARESDTQTFRETIGETLGEVGNPETVKKFAQALNQSAKYSADVRYEITLALGYFSKNPEAIDVLISALKDPNRSIQFAAVLSLGKNRSPKAIPHLIQLAKNHITYDAIYSLSKYGRDLSPEAIDFLIRTVEKDLSWEYRVRAIDALGTIGDRKAVEVLTKTLNDEDAHLRSSAIHALEQIGDPRALSALEAVLNDHKPPPFRYESEKSAARKAIEKIKQTNPPRSEVRQEISEVLDTLLELVDENVQARTALLQLQNLLIHGEPFGDLPERLRNHVLNQQDFFLGPLEEEYEAIRNKPGASQLEQQIDSYRRAFETLNDFLSPRSEVRSQSKIKRLVTSLANQDPRKVDAAIDALGNYGEAAQDTVSAILNAERGDSSKKVEALIKISSPLKERAIPLLQAPYYLGDVSRQKIIISVIKRLPPAIKKQMLPWLHSFIAFDKVPPGSVDSDLQGRIISLIGTMGPDAQAEISNLIDLVFDPKQAYGVSDEAARSLVSLIPQLEKKPRKEAIEKINNQLEAIYLSDSKRLPLKSRAYGIRILNQLAPKLSSKEAARAVKTLIHIFKNDVNPQIRDLAVEILLNIGIRPLPRPRSEVRMLKWLRNSLFLLLWTANPSIRGKSSQTAGAASRRFARSEMQSFDFLKPIPKIPKPEENDVKLLKKESNPPPGSILPLDKKLLDKAIASIVTYSDFYFELNRYEEVKGWLVKLYAQLYPDSPAIRAMILRSPVYQPGQSSYELLKEILFLMAPPDSLQKAYQFVNSLVHDPHFMTFEEKQTDLAEALFDKPSNWERMQFDFLDHALRSEVRAFDPVHFWTDSETWSDPFYLVVNLAVLGGVGLGIWFYYRKVVRPRALKEEKTEEKNIQEIITRFRKGGMEIRTFEGITASGNEFYERNKKRFTFWGREQLKNALNKAAEELKGRKAKREKFLVDLAKDFEALIQREVSGKVKEIKEKAKESPNQVIDVSRAVAGFRLQMEQKMERFRIANKLEEKEIPVFRKSLEAAVPTFEREISKYAVLVQSAQDQAKKIMDFKDAIIRSDKEAATEAQTKISHIIESNQSEIEKLKAAAVEKIRKRNTENAMPHFDEDIRLLLTLVRDEIQQEIGIFYAAKSKLLQDFTSFMKGAVLNFKEKEEPAPSLVEEAATRASEEIHRELAGSPLPISAETITDEKWKDGIEAARGEISRQMEIDSNLLKIAQRKVQEIAPAKALALEEAGRLKEDASMKAAAAVTDAVAYIEAAKNEAIELLSKKIEGTKNADIPKAGEEAHQHFETEAAEVLQSFDQDIQKHIEELRASGNRLADRFKVDVEKILSDWEINEGLAFESVRQAASSAIAAVETEFNSLADQVREAAEANLKSQIDARRRALQDKIQQAAAEAALGKIPEYQRKAQDIQKKFGDELRSPQNRRLAKVVNAAANREIPDKKVLSGIEGFVTKQTGEFYREIGGLIGLLQKAQPASSGLINEESAQMPGSQNRSEVRSVKEKFKARLADLKNVSSRSRHNRWFADPEVTESILRNIEREEYFWAAYAIQLLVHDARMESSTPTTLFERRLVSLRTALEKASMPRDLLKKIQSVRQAAERNRPARIEELIEFLKVTYGDITLAQIVERYKRSPKWERYIYRTGPNVYEKILDQAIEADDILPLILSRLKIEPNAEIESRYSPRIKPFKTPIDQAKFLHRFASLAVRDLKKMNQEAPPLNQGDEATDEYHRYRIAGRNPNGIGYKAVISASRSNLASEGQVVILVQLKSHLQVSDVKTLMGETGDYIHYTPETGLAVYYSHDPADLIKQLGFPRDIDGDIINLVPIRAIKTLVQIKHTEAIPKLISMVTSGRLSGMGRRGADYWQRDVAEAALKAAVELVSLPKVSREHKQLVEEKLQELISANAQAIGNPDFPIQVRLFQRWLRGDRSVSEAAGIPNSLLLAENNFSDKVLSHEKQIDGASQGRRRQAVSFDLEYKVIDKIEEGVRQSANYGWNQFVAPRIYYLKIEEPADHGPKRRVGGWLVQVFNPVSSEDKSELKFYPAEEIEGRIHVPFFPPPFGYRFTENKKSKFAEEGRIDDQSEAFLFAIDAFSTHFFPFSELAQEFNKLVGSMGFIFTAGKSATEVPYSLSLYEVKAVGAEEVSEMKDLIEKLAALNQNLAQKAKGPSGILFELFWEDFARVMQLIAEKLSDRYKSKEPIEAVSLKETQELVSLAVHFSNTLKYVSSYFTQYEDRTHRSIAERYEYEINFLLFNILPRLIGSHENEDVKRLAAEGILSVSQKVRGMIALFLTHNEYSEGHPLQGLVDRFSYLAPRLLLTLSHTLKNISDVDSSLVSDLIQIMDDMSVIFETRVLEGPDRSFDFHKSQEASSIKTEVLSNITAFSTKIATGTALQWKEKLDGLQKRIEKLQVGRSEVRENLPKDFVAALGQNDHAAVKRRPVAQKLLERFGDVFGNRRMNPDVNNAGNRGGQEIQKIAVARDNDRLFFRRSGKDFGIFGLIRRAYDFMSRLFQEGFRMAGNIFIKKKTHRQADLFSERHKLTMPKLFGRIMQSSAYVIGIQLGVIFLGGDFFNRNSGLEQLKNDMNRNPGRAVGKAKTRSAVANFGMDNKKLGNINGASLHEQENSTGVGAGQVTALRFRSEVRNQTKQAAGFPIPEGVRAAKLDAKVFLNEEIVKMEKWNKETLPVSTSLSAKYDDTLVSVNLSPLEIVWMIAQEKVKVFQLYFEDGRTLKILYGPGLSNLKEFSVLDQVPRDIEVPDRKWIQWDARRAFEARRTDLLEKLAQIAEANQWDEFARGLRIGRRALLSRSEVRAKNDFDKDMARLVGDDILIVNSELYLLMTLFRHISKNKNHLNLLRRWQSLSSDERNENFNPTEFLDIVNGFENGALGAWQNMNWETEEILKQWALNVTRDMIKMIELFKILLPSKEGAKLEKSFNQFKDHLELFFEQFGRFKGIVFPDYRLKNLESLKELFKHERLHQKIQSAAQSEQNSLYDGYVQALNVDDIRQSFWGFISRTLYAAHFRSPEGAEKFSEEFWVQVGYSPAAQWPEYQNFVSALREFAQKKTESDIAKAFTILESLKLEAEQAAERDFEKMNDLIPRSEVRRINSKTAESIIRSGGFAKLRTKLTPKNNLLQIRPSVNKDAPRSEVRSQSEEGRRFSSLSISDMGFSIAKSPRVTGTNNSELAHRIEVFHRPEQYAKIAEGHELPRLTGDILTFEPDPNGPLSYLRGLVEIYAGKDQTGQLRYLGISLFKSAARNSDYQFVGLETGSGRFFFSSVNARLFYTDSDTLILFDLIRRNLTKVERWMEAVNPIMNLKELGPALNLAVHSLADFYAMMTHLQSEVKSGILDSIDFKEKSDGVVLNLRTRDQQSFELMTLKGHRTVADSGFNAWLKKNPSRSEVRTEFVRDLKPKDEGNLTRSELRKDSRRFEREVRFVAGKVVNAFRESRTPSSLTVRQTVYLATADAGTFSNALEKTMKELQKADQNIPAETLIPQNILDQERDRLLATLKTNTLDGKLTIGIAMPESITDPITQQFAKVFLKYFKSLGGEILGTVVISGKMPREWAELKENINLRPTSLNRRPMDLDAVFIPIDVLGQRSELRNIASSFMPVFTNGFDRLTDPRLRELGYTLELAAITSLARIALKNPALAKNRSELRAELLRQLHLSAGGQNLITFGNDGAFEIRGPALEIYMRAQAARASGRSA